MMAIKTSVCLLTLPPTCLCPCCSKTQGQLMLERMRAAGRPVTPAMEKMAAWMDAQEQSAMAGDMPMLKPGELHTSFACHRTCRDVCSLLMWGH
jgi:hypothetical protein